MNPLISASIAGLLTSFSPCVISALPFVVSSSMSENKKGPVFLVVGLISSFVIIGVLFALTSKILGINQESLKIGTAILFIFIGLVFLFSKLNLFISKLLSPIANNSNNLVNKLQLSGNFGQFALGFLLGFIWSPCSGPSLGFAITLVAKQNEIIYGATIMAIYGLAASIPLLFIAYLSRTLIQRHMNKIEVIYSFIKQVLGLFLIILGIMTISGLDKLLEALLIKNMPQFILDLITKF